MDHIDRIRFDYTLDYSRPLSIVDYCVVNKFIKLYPLEWLAHEAIHDPTFIEDYEQSDPIEPAWKLIVGNKSLLPMLWQM